MLMKNVFFFLALVLVGVLTQLLPLYAQDNGENGNEENDDEEKEKTIAETVKDFEKLEGLFTLYRNPKNGGLMMEILPEQLEREYIYFSYSENGVVASGHFRGNYRDQAIFRLHKYYDRIEFVEQNTSFYFDPESPLSRAAEANISAAVLASSKIVATTENKDRYLINLDDVLLNESLHKLTPMPDPEKKPHEQFSLGKLSKNKTRYASVRVYPENLNIQVDYVYDNESPYVRGGLEVTDPRSITLTLQHSFLLVPDNECKNLIVRNVRVEWTNGPDRDNGAYGLYPVQCENVLIDGVVAIGASDAGIYVGQSNMVVVKNSRAEFNVAGIEIENTTNADVFDNVATNNTGGILVFNMPNLPQTGARTRVFRNRISSNNTANFAPKGTAVSGVPAGSGVVINSNDEVEIFNNDISDNATANIIISSLFSTGYADRSTAENFDPYPEAIYIYDNNFEGGGDAPDGLDLKTLKVAMYGLTGSFPDIIWDGFVNEDLLVNGKQPQASSICVKNSGAVVLNVDAPNKYQNARDDMDAHLCELPLLPAIELPFS